MATSWSSTDLSFVVQPGVVTGFLGPNGAGKSTTMRLIVSFVRRWRSRTTSCVDAMHDLSASVDETGVDNWTDADWTQRLIGQATTDRYTSAEIEELPEPVQRYFTSSIAPGTPLTKTVQLRMRGFIKVGTWLPFRARQVSNPHVGFRWAARAAGVIAGFDRYIDGVGAMRWKVAGRFRVADADGPDISKSAAGRCGCEGLMVPTSLLPRFGVVWTAEDDRHITARLQLDATPVVIGLTIDPRGRVDTIAVRRWGDPEQTGTWSWHTFGGEVTAHRTFAGLTVPSRGRLGWDYGTSRWPAGEFFRYQITALTRTVERAAEQFGVDRGRVGEEQHQRARPPV